MSTSNDAPALAAEGGPAASAEQRAAALNTAVAANVATGWTVQFASPDQVVLTKVARMGWFFNTVLVILTAGLWLIYVIYRALNRKVDRLVLTVDARARVRVTRR